MRLSKLALIIGIASSCNSSTESAISTITYEQFVIKNINSKPKSDTLALGFILGQSEKQVDQHFKFLLTEGKIEGPVDYDAGFFQASGVHPYQLYINDSVSAKTFIGTSFFNDTIATLTFFGEIPSSDSKFYFEDVLSFLRNRLGTETVVERSTDSNNEKYHWIDGYKDIVLGKLGTYLFVIEYSDLRIKKTKNDLETAADSLKKAVEKEKFDKSKSDIK